MMYLYRLLFLFLSLFIAGCSGGGSPSTGVTGVINTTAIETCFDVEVTNAGDRSTKNICTTKENGAINKLGVNRFVRFTVVNTSATVSIRVTRTSGLNPADPDIFLFKNGGAPINQALTIDPNVEAMTTPLSSGDYVVMINEFSYFDIETNAKAQFNKLVSQKNTIIQPAQSSDTPCVDGTPSTVTGTVQFERVPISADNRALNYSAQSLQPIQEAVVEVICNTRVFSSSVTDALGFYSLSYPDNLSSFVRVKAQMLEPSGKWNFSVVNNSIQGQQPIYAMDDSANTLITGAVTRDFNAGSGWGGFSYSGTRTAGPFAILDSIRKAKNIIAAQTSATFTTLKINWNANVLGGTGTFYDSTKKEITLSGVENSDTDEYDEHVIIHEFGHYYEDTFSRSDSIGGSHSLRDILDIRVAFGEGFGNAFSAMATGNPIYTDTNGFAQGSGFNFSLENNSCFNAGWFNECSVQSILYDIFDGNNDDAINSGFAPIHAVFAGAQKNTPAFTSIFSFIKAFKDQNTGDVNAIDTLTNNQNIDPVSDIYGSSQISANPGATDGLPVYEAF